MILLYLKRTVPDGQTQAAVASSTILTTVAIQAVERIIPMYRMTIPAVMTMIDDSTGGDDVYVPDDTTGGDTTGGDTTGGDTTGGDTSGGDTTGGDTSGGDMSGGDTGSGGDGGDIDAGGDASDAIEASEQGAPGEADAA